MHDEKDIFWRKGNFATMKITQLIYTSALSSPAKVIAVPSILRGSRARNPLFGITGVLLFDGHHFCGWLEGEPHLINQLHRNIERDERHADFKVINHKETDGMRMFAGWSVGYSKDCVSGAIPELIKAPREKLGGSFSQLIRSFDLA